MSCHRKGKKDGKQDSKADKESEIEKAKASAALCALRLQVSDESLAQYREACSTLARANEQLTNQLYHQERESLDITDYLKRQNEAKEEKVCVSAKCRLVSVSPDRLTVFFCSGQSKYEASLRDAFKKKKKRSS